MDFPNILNVFVFHHSGATLYNPNSLSQMILSPALYIISLMTCLMLLRRSATNKTSA